MSTKSKLVALELVAGIFGWGWLISGAATVLFFVMAVGFEGDWLHVVWALVACGVCKWLATGFKENQTRVAFEAEKIAQGMKSLPC